MCGCWVDESIMLKGLQINVGLRCFLCYAFSCWTKLASKVKLLVILKVSKFWSHFAEGVKLFPWFHLGWILGNDFVNKRIVKKISCHTCSPSWRVILWLFILAFSLVIILVAILAFGFCFLGKHHHLCATSPTLNQKQASIVAVTTMGALRIEESNVSIIRKVVACCDVTAPQSAQ